MTTITPKRVFSNQNSSRSSKLSKEDEFINQAYTKRFSSTLNQKKVYSTPNIGKKPVRSKSTCFRNSKIVYQTGKKYSSNDFSTNSEDEKMFGRINPCMHPLNYSDSVTLSPNNLQESNKVQKQEISDDDELLKLPADELLKLCNSLQLQYDQAVNKKQQLLFQRDDLLSQIESLKISISENDDFSIPVPV